MLFNWKVFFSVFSLWSSTIYAQDQNHRTTASLRGNHNSSSSRALQVNLGKFLFSDLLWKSINGGIFLNGKQFHMKGVNWFGMETETRALHGLWKTNLDDILDLLSLNKFNVLRLPLSYSFAQNLALPVRGVTDLSLQGLNSGDLLEEVIKRAAERGIMVLLALHDIGATDGRNGTSTTSSKVMKSNNNTDPANMQDKSVAAATMGDKSFFDYIPGNGLWYQCCVSYGDFQNAWRNVLSRYGHHWNVVGIDLFNRPGRGKATWGTGDPSFDWNLAAEDTAATLIREFPAYKGLWFFQGLSGGEFFANFATDLRGALEYPIDLFTAESNQRAVYEAQILGPSVSATMNSVYSTMFPDNLYQAYDTLFGQIEKTLGNALIIGKWGGSLNDDQQGDRIWQQAVSDYMINNCLDDNIYWALNPNTNCAGGLLLDDWRTLNMPKIDLLNRIQPNPSTLIKDPLKELWTFVSGSSAKDVCNK